MGVPSKLGVASRGGGITAWNMSKNCVFCYHTRNYLYLDCPLSFLLLKFVRDPCTIHRVNVQISYTVAFMSAKEFTKAC